MAASGIMDHNVAGSLASQVAGAHTGMAAEKIAAGELGRNLPRPLTHAPIRRIR